MTKANTLKLLKLIKRRGQASRVELMQYCSTRDINRLCYKNYIYQLFDDNLTDGQGGWIESDDDLFVIGDAGLDCLDNNATDLRRTWWPHIGNVILAIIAIVISIIALKKR